MNPKTILVTGSAGFIGGNFVRQFKGLFPNTNVVGLDIVQSKNGEDIFYKGSITDSKLLDRVFSKRKPEYVFHFAAIPRVSYSVIHPAETTYVNIYGTVLLLEKSRLQKNLPNTSAQRLSEAMIFVSCCRNMKHRMNILAS